MAEELAGTHRQTWRRMASLTAASVAVVALGACGSSGSGTTGTTTSGGSTSSSTSGGGSGGGGGSSSQLNALTETVNRGKTATYKAVYTYTGGGSGTNGPVTIEQKPPKSLLTTSAGEVINNGSTTYFCATDSKTCLNAGSSNPLAGLTQVFSPETITEALQAASAEAAAHQAGASVTFSSGSFAGQSADCVTVSANGQTGKYCVTHSGALADVETTQGKFQLTSYSASVSDGDFSLPAGATVQTIP